MKKQKKIFAAMLLFQYRKVVKGRSNKKRLCEERIVHINAESAADAVKIAKRYGKEEEHSFELDNGRHYFEFIGVLELIDFGIAFKNFEVKEVWWRLIEKVTPQERKNKIIPVESKLSALRQIPRKGGLKL